MANYATGAEHQNYTHGLCYDPFYMRWSNIHKWCYNPKSPEYERFGAKGIRVDPIWHRDNPKGVENFSGWLEREMKKHPNGHAMVVCRVDTSKNFSPENCVLRTRSESNQLRRNAVLTLRDVVRARRLKRALPKEMTLELLSETFGVSMKTMSCLLRGVTWANANRLEAPLPKYYGLYKTTGVKSCTGLAIPTSASSSSALSLSL